MVGEDDPTEVPPHNRLAQGIIYGPISNPPRARSTAITDRHCSAMVCAVLHSGSNHRKDSTRIGDRIYAIILTPYVAMTRAEEHVCFRARAVGWAKLVTSQFGVDLQTGPAFGRPAIGTAPIRRASE